MFLPLGEENQTKSLINKAKHTKKIPLTVPPGRRGQTEHPSASGTLSSIKGTQYAWESPKFNGQCSAKWKHTGIKLQGVDLNYHSPCF